MIRNGTGAYFRAGHAGRRNTLFATRQPETSASRPGRSGEKYQRSPKMATVSRKTEMQNEFNQPDRIAGGAGGTQRRDPFCVLALIQSGLADRRHADQFVFLLSRVVAALFVLSTVGINQRRPQQAAERLAGSNGMQIVPQQTPKRPQHADPRPRRPGSGRLRRPPRTSPDCS